MARAVLNALQLGFSFGTADGSLGHGIVTVLRYLDGIWLDQSMVLDPWSELSVLHESAMLSNTRSNQFRPLILPKKMGLNPP